LKTNSSAGGHLHDGGVNQQLLINGKVICDSGAKYGGAEATMSKEPTMPKAGGHSHGGSMAGMDASNAPKTQVWETLSSMSYCNDAVQVKKGDVLTLVSNYDLDKHPAREHAEGGGMAEEMGLMLFSLAQKSKAS
jgi:hypothetical protein